MANIAPVIAFVFRPNSSTSPGNVYNDWPSLVAALNSVQGRKILEFDDTVPPNMPPKPCLIPPGDWDMTDVMWAGYGPRPGAPRAIVVIQDGTTFTGLRMIGGQITIENRANDKSPISDFIDGPAGANHVQIGMRDDCGNTQIFNSGDAPLFNLGKPAPTKRRIVFFFLQNTLFGIRQNPSTQTSNPLITHDGVDCTINFIGQNQVGNGILQPPATADFGALSSSTQIGVDNILVYQNKFEPVTRIQRKVQPQPPTPPARSMVEIGEIARPNVLLRCDGHGYSGSGFVVTLPNIQNGFLFSGQDPTPLYTGGQEIVVAEIAGGGRLTVSPSAGDTIDGNTGLVQVLGHESRTFVSDGYNNWITTSIIAEGGVSSSGARINSIRLHIQTGALSGAETNGDVYLGVCGREFFVDTTSNDFERGSKQEFIFGDGSNVNNASENDPRNQLLLVENVDKFPVYVRFQPEGRNDNWQLQRAEVRFNSDLFPVWDTSSFVANNPNTGIWLGTGYGLVVHIPKHVD